MQRGRNPWRPALPAARGNARPQDHPVNYFTNSPHGGASGTDRGVAVPIEQCSKARRGPRIPNHQTTRPRARLGDIARDRRLAWRRDHGCEQGRPGHGLPTGVRPGGDEPRSGRQGGPLDGSTSGQEGAQHRLDADAGRHSAARINVQPIAHGSEFHRLARRNGLMRNARRSSAWGARPDTGLPVRFPRLLR